jgi:hypothetical protein
MKSGSGHTRNAVEQVVSRALRENLENLQRSVESLNDAIADVVAACSSTRPTNTLPPMLRAQTAAASLSAALDVLSRFVVSALRPAQHGRSEAEVAPLEGVAGSTAEAEEVVGAEEGTESVVEIEPSAEEEAVFDVSRLSPQEQAMHHRANRVAKVSMQDIKMLHPDQVRLGREKRDVCMRLRDDIDRAYKEYHRRFRPIMDHPVDYFYYWMVEILGGGDAQALGEYPYASPVGQS